MLLTACATPRVAPHVDTQIAQAIATDLFGVITTQLPPAHTTITITPQDEVETGLENLFRKAGYATRTAGDQNRVTLAVFFMEDDASYIGSIRVGHQTRITRKYRYSPDGLVQIGATAIGR